ncbi:hypothetical protein DSM112329_04715 [Paraconexibacter sp. AEG42_29]|uniref:HTH cro/C1-type domain-containing protein n=1 Tax=Paraconexibacter sp. AEG42_29 TaxID=2997339 RepID=A0AAU7B1N0_9ACTN
MIPTTETLLNEFIDAWNAGERPSVRTYLRRVPEGDARDRLATELESWLEAAPTPRYSNTARAAIRAEPVVQRVFSAAGEDAGLWPVVLPELRQRARLSLSDVAGRIAQRFGLAARDEERAATYLGELEAGRLEPTRVSRRLLETLADVLGASPGTLADAASFGRPLRPAGALFRADDLEDADWVADDLAVIAQAAMAPAPAAALDEVDRLFLGGPEG